MIKSYKKLFGLVSKLRLWNNLVLILTLRLRRKKVSVLSWHWDSGEKKSGFHLEMGTKKKVSLLTPLLRLRVINSWSQSCTQKYGLSTLCLRICSAINNNFVAELIIRSLTVVQLSLVQLCPSLYLLLRSAFFLKSASACYLISTANICYFARIWQITPY